MFAASHEISKRYGSRASSCADEGADASSAMMGDADAEKGRGTKRGAEGCREEEVERGRGEGLARTQRGTKGRRAKGRAAKGRGEGRRDEEPRDEEPRDELQRDEEQRDELQRNSDGDVSGCAAERR